MRTLSGTLILTALLAASPATRAAAQDDPDVKWASQAASIHVTNAPRAIVLLKLARLADFEIVGLEHVDGSVTTSLDAQPLQATLDSLLQGFAFVLVADKPAPGAKTPAPHYTLKISGVQAKKGTRNPILIPVLEQTSAQDGTDPPDPEEEAQKRDEEQELGEELAQVEADGLFDPKSPIGPLVEAATEHDNRMVRVKALEVLNQRDPARALKPLIEAMTDNEEDVVKRAVTLLSQRDDQASLKRLEATLLKESDTSLRLGSIHALALRADPACIPALKEVAEDKDQFFKDIATQILAEFAAREKVSR